MYKEWIFAWKLSESQGTPCNLSTGSNIQTKNYLVLQQTLKKLANMTKWLTFVVGTCLYGLLNISICYVTYVYKSVFSI